MNDLPAVDVLKTRRNLHKDVSRLGLRETGDIRIVVVIKDTWKRKDSRVNCKKYKYKVTIEPLLT